MSPSGTLKDRQVGVFSHIVLPLDGSGLAAQIIPYVGALASTIGVRVKLLHVIDPDTLFDVHAAHYLEQEVDRRRSWARVYLRQIQLYLRDLGAAAEAMVDVGPPASCIAEAAGSDGALIAMATLGRTGLERLLVGSVANEVLKLGTMPLLLYKPQEGRARPEGVPRTLIVPLDGSPAAEQALPVATFLARALSARIVIARVVPVPALVARNRAAPRGRYSSPGLPEAAVAGEYVAGIVESLQTNGLEAEPMLPRGDPGAELALVASQLPDSLVVMGTHTHSGLGRLVQGSVTHRVTRECGCPVLIVPTLDAGSD